MHARPKKLRPPSHLQAARLATGRTALCSRLPPFHRVSDSSGDASLFTRYMEARTDNFHVMTGSAGLLTEALRMGADGGILAAALFAPAFALEIFAAVKEGHVARTDAAQAQLTPLGARIVGAMGVPGVKAALDAVGSRGGEPRLPLLPLEAALRGELLQLLAAAGLARGG